MALAVLGEDDVKEVDVKLCEAESDVEADGQLVRRAHSIQECRKK